MKNLVDIDWLKSNLNNEKLVIVDCRFDLMNKEYGKVSYEKGHIKGAQRIDVETQLSDEVCKHGGRHPLPNINQLRRIFENIGINNDSIIVCYDEGDLAGPSRLWWILKYMGHKNVYILDGGINLFEKMGGEITTEIKRIKKGNFEININDDMLVDMEYVKSSIENRNSIIVDSRENKRYIGQVEPVDKKAGHIPTAVNYFWMDVLEKENNNMNLKSIDKLRNHFNELLNYNEVIVYCGSGITACVNSLGLDEANIEHKVYQGSFSDWISYDENIVEV